MFYILFRKSALWGCFWNLGMELGNDGSREGGCAWTSVPIRREGFQRCLFWPHTLLTLTAPIGVPWVLSLDRSHTFWGGFEKEKEPGSENEEQVNWKEAKQKNHRMWKTKWEREEGRTWNIEERNNKKHNTKREKRRGEWEKEGFEIWDGKKK